MNNDVGINQLLATCPPRRQSFAVGHASQAARSEAGNGRRATTSSFSTHSGTLRNDFLVVLEAANIPRQNYKAIIAALNSCPVAGQGVNRYCFKTALKLHQLGLPASVIEQLLELATGDCGREMKAGEIERAIRNSHPDRLGTHKPQRKWPARNDERIEAIARGGFGMRELTAQSPITGLTAESVVDALFPANPLLCCGTALDRPQTFEREVWRGMLAAQQFIVPSPMSARKGMTRDGKPGPRSLDNTGPRAYLVIEFDFAITNKCGEVTPASELLRDLESHGITVGDLCAALHRHLADLWPLALVVHSGGKSLHGWYPCAGADEEALLRFMRYAVSLGADEATWTPCQFVRCPGGRRGTGALQKVLYFNPNVIGGAK